MTKLETLHSFKRSEPSKASSLAETQLQMQALQSQFSQTLAQMQDLQQQLLLSQSKFDKSQKALSIERQRLRNLMSTRADWTQLIAVAAISGLIAAGLSMLLK